MVFLGLAVWIRNCVAEQILPRCIRLKVAGPVVQEAALTESPPGMGKIAGIGPACLGRWSRRLPTSVLSPTASGARVPDQRWKNWWRRALETGLLEPAP